MPRGPFCRSQTIPSSSGTRQAGRLGTPSTRRRHCPQLPPKQKGPRGRWYLIDRVKVVTPERRRADATVSPRTPCRRSPSSVKLSGWVKGGSEHEVPALLTPSVDGDGRGDLADAHVAALADGRGAEFLPLERAVGAVVLLDHAGEGPAGAGQLLVVAGPDRGGEVVRIVEQREAHERFEIRQRHGDEDGHEQLGGGELVLFDALPVPV